MEKAISFLEINAKDQSASTRIYILYSVSSKASLEITFNIAHKTEK